ncbi:MAG TPA: hypothetical protein VGY66_03150 [Gemmataceae bacterium]|nr:hypothetical protein [Gemmataceae bacterium]
MIPVYYQRLTVKRRGTALAVSMLGVHFAEMLLPKQLAVRIQAVKPARAEEREDKLPIGDWRSGRQAAADMPRFVRQLLMHRLLPQDRAVAAADCQDHKLVMVGQEQIVMGAGTFGKARPYGFALGDRRGQENAVSPNNRRGMPLPRKGNFPANIVFLTPFDGRVGVRRDPGG